MCLFPARYSDFFHAASKRAALLIDEGPARGSAELQPRAPRSLLSASSIPAKQLKMCFGSLMDFYALKPL